MAQTLPYSVVKRTSSRKRKDGTTWESKNYFLRYRNGDKLIYEDLGTSIKREAEANAFDIYASKAKKLPTPYSRRSLRTYVLKNNWTDPLLCPPYKEFQSNLTNHSFRYQNSKRVAKSLDFVFNVMEDEIGAKDYASIKKADVKAFKERLLSYRDKDGKPLKASVINRVFTALNDVYRYIINNEENDLEINPFSSDYSPRVPTEAPKKKFVFQPKEVKRLLDYDLLKMCKDFKLVMFEGTKREKVFTERFYNAFLDGPLYKIICIMALTGMRFNEVAALKKRCFKFEGHVLEITEAFKVAVYGSIMGNYLAGDKSIEVFGPPKNGRPRSIVLCDRAYYLLKPLLDECVNDDDLLFVRKTEEGQPRNLYPVYENNNKQYMTMFLRGFCDKFNINVPEDEVVSPHCLRTTLNSNLLKEDVKESWVAAYMGWKTETLTQVQAKHYTQFGLDTMWKVAESINYLYTGKRMLWSSRELEKRDYNVEAAEAEIRGQKQELKFLTLKMKMLELRLRLTDFARMGGEGPTIRNAFRAFLNATEDFSDMDDFNSIRNLLALNEGSVLSGIETCELNFPQEAEALKAQVYDLYKAAFIELKK